MKGTQWPPDRREGLHTPGLPRVGLSHMIPSHTSKLHPSMFTAMETHTCGHMWSGTNCIKGLQEKFENQTTSRAWPHQEASEKTGLFGLSQWTLFYRCLTPNVNAESLSYTAQQISTCLFTYLCIYLVIKWFPCWYLKSSHSETWTIFQFIQTFFMSLRKELQRSS